MQLRIQTSDINTGIKYLPDLKYLYDLGRCSKCQMFILLQSTNKLYGFSDDCCCIHEIDIPYKVDTDLMFRLDEIDKDALLVSDNKYFIPTDFNWVILHEDYWEAYIGGDLYCEFDPYFNNFIVKDKNTLKPIPQFMTHKYRDSDDYMMHNVFMQLSGYFNRQHTLDSMIEFTGLESNPVVRTIFDSKASIGRQLLVLDNSILIYLYKGLFSLNKADSLSVQIRFDKFEKNTFLATYCPKKKKNPLMENSYGAPFVERIHCMYLNMV